MLDPEVSTTSRIAPLLLGNRQHHMTGNRQAAARWSKWLNLPTLATLAALYHTSVLALPFFSHYQLKAKVDYLHSISISMDPTLHELSDGLSIQNVPRSILTPSLDLLQAVKACLSTETNDQRGGPGSSQARPPLHGATI